MFMGLRNNKMSVFVEKQRMSVVLLIICVFLSKGYCNIEDKKVALFVFGDSLVEVGNNNYIVSLSKANFPPNGIDFGSPTGRFTNGRTIVDIIGEHVGVGGSTPPYLAPSTRGINVILKGVNYASGGGGILYDTGNIFGGRLNLDVQLDNFEKTRQEIVNNIGEISAKGVFENALFSVTIGSNDFINNYLTPLVSKLEQTFVSPQDFVDALISKYTLQLTRLYKLGGKKIVVVNVGPIGCIPFEREMNPSEGNECAVFPNQLAQMFNSRLKGLVTQLTSNLQGSNFVYADIYRVFHDIVADYSSYGFENANTSCCNGGGVFGGLIPCGPTSKVCNDRSKYVFWDPYHPSEAANLIIANRLIYGNSSYISPINIQQLINS